MNELKNSHKTVARYIALGVPLKDICEKLSLSYSTWSRITSEELFKAEIKRVQGELEDTIIEDAVKDPTHAILLASSVSAAKVLIDEMKNTDPSSGASSATRIKAATSLLDRTGYASAPSTQVSQNLIFQLSQEKLDLVLKGTQRPVEQPDSIEG